ncbi:MAG: hypothetical protein A3E01_09280 [Gammaproteobacteria bacterium RIFCSPHIGHO2_12_FULL_63_22]|nr:MAG: hypothetical protein A3E01_09280 [Gammaproteobacteria bacterium RIFCSPHIGHO2_12_FULL_63_22]
MYFADRLTLDAPRRTKDGFLAVRAKAARLGVYDYAGSEVDPENKHGLRDQATVKVLRDENTVFDERAVKSFIGKPITDNHPSQAVTADNWRQHARGTVMGAMRDGDYLAFDLMVTDAEAISKIEAGKRELSNGYAADLEFGLFTAADGTVCPVRQASISGNHVALVDHGRAGSNCAIKDGEKFAICDANPAAMSAFNMEKKVPKITLDGLVVDLSDAAAVEAAIKKFQDAATAAQKTLADAKAAHDKEMAAKDAEIDKLKGQVVDQAKIDALADAKATVVADAKKIAGDKLGDTAGKTVADVRRMAVAAKLGDAAVADKSDDYIEARFDGLKDGGTSDPIAQNLRDQRHSTTNDNASVRDFVRAAQY